MAIKFIHRFSARMYNDAVTTNSTVFDEPQRSSEYTAASNVVIRNTQTIGTTYEAIAVSDLAGLGYGRFINRDATNYVEVGVEVSAAFYPLIKLRPGMDSGWVPLAAVTLYARANTASVKMEYVLTDTVT